MRGNRISGDPPVWPSRATGHCSSPMTQTASSTASLTGRLAPGVNDFERVAERALDHRERCHCGDGYKPPPGRIWHMAYEILRWPNYPLLEGGVMPFRRR